MNPLLKLRPGWAITLFVVADTVCVGMGMGVPIFCILFGFPVGWYLALRLAPDPGQLPLALSRILRWAAGTAGFTFLQLLLTVFSLRVSPALRSAVSRDGSGVEPVRARPLGSPHFCNTLLTLSG